MNQPQVLPGATRASGPRHILVADPETRERARVVALVQELAPELGRLVVHTAADGHAALGLIEQHRPEVVIAEVLLEGISGLALLRRVRRTHTTAVPAFVFLTTMVRESDRYWGLRNGAHGYVMKPYEDELLQAKIRDILGAESSPDRLGAL